jgi:hypothetical protein
MRATAASIISSVGFDLQPLQLQPLDLRLGHVRQGLDLDLDHGVAADLVAFVEPHARLHGRADALVVEELLHAVLDGGFQRLLLEARPVHLADQIGRDLAGAEAGHLHLRRDRLQLGIDAGIDLLGGNRDAEAALQTLVQRLYSLHGVGPELSY